MLLVHLLMTVWNAALASPERISEQCPVLLPATATANVIEASVTALAPMTPALLFDLLDRRVFGQERVPPREGTAGLLGGTWALWSLLHSHKTPSQPRQTQSGSAVGWRCQFPTLLRAPVTV